MTVEEAKKRLIDAGINKYLARSEINTLSKNGTIRIDEMDVVFLTIKLQQDELKDLRSQIDTLNEKVYNLKIN